jgi:hypothetical protein
MIKVAYQASIEPITIAARPDMPHSQYTLELRKASRTAIWNARQAKSVTLETAIRTTNFTGQRLRFPIDVRAQHGFDS